MSIRRVKQAAIVSLQMNEAAALDFARFVVEQSGSSNGTASRDVTIDKNFIRVDEDKVAQALRIMLFLT